MKIVWLSANDFGWHLLQTLTRMYKGRIVDAIITLSSESKTIMYDINNNFEVFELPLYKIDNINEQEELLDRLKPDIIIVAGWRQIIDKKLLDNYTFIGFHPTLLPFGRGPAPIINTILNDITESGVTMFYINEEMDSGDIIGQSTFTLRENNDSSDVYSYVIECGQELIKKYIPKILNGTAPRIPQDKNKAIYFDKPKLKDNKINLDDDIDDIYKKIRALSYPYRGAYIEKDGKKLIIWEADLIDE